MFLTRRQFIGYSLGLCTLSFIRWPSWSRYVNPRNVFKTKKVSSPAKIAASAKSKASFSKKPYLKKNFSKNEMLTQKSSGHPVVKHQTKTLYVHAKKKSVSAKDSKKLLVPEKRKLFLPHDSTLSRTQKTRLLSISYSHTGEKLLKVPYFDNGHYNMEVCQALSRLLRDHRSGDVKFLDPKIYDVLYFIAQKISHHDPLCVISGFRSARTNETMRRSGRGVAKNSYHVQAKAVDIKFRGMNLRRAQSAAKSLRLGGVGTYSRDGFLHVDVRGRLVCWGR